VVIVERWLAEPAARRQPGDPDPPLEPAPHD
jgi:hypothetical protein